VSDSLTATASCFVSIKAQRNSDRDSFGLSDIISEIIRGIRQYLLLNTGTIGQLSNKPLSLHRLTPSADRQQSIMVSRSLTYHPINVMIPFEEDFMCT
jgi:hypothetical protein